MHLVYKALEKHAIPSVLPPELMPPAKRKDSIPLSKSPAPPVVPPVPIQPIPSVAAVNSLAGLEAVKVCKIVRYLTILLTTESSQCFAHVQRRFNRP